MYFVCFKCEFNIYMKLYVVLVRYVFLWNWYLWIMLLNGYFLIIYLGRERDGERKRERESLKCNGVWI